MEAGTATSHSTGSKTIADLIGQAALKHAGHVAVRHKVDGAWQDVTYAQVGEIVSEIGRGLIDLGVQPGERVCILCDTRPEWTYADFAISSAGDPAIPPSPTGTRATSRSCASGRKLDSTKATERGAHMGILDKIRGRAKQAAGDLADDPALRREGLAEERKGEAKEELDEAQQRAADKAVEIEELDRRTS